MAESWGHSVGHAVNGSVAVGDAIGASPTGPSPHIAKGAEVDRDRPTLDDTRAAEIVSPSRGGPRNGVTSVTPEREWLVEAGRAVVEAGAGGLVPAEAWRRWRSLISRWLDPVTELMLDLAGVRYGHRVLDVAAGAGGQTILAAQRAGQAGYVLATDVCPEMLTVARQVLGEAGAANAGTAAMDALELGVPPAAFDVAICRLGLMYLPSPKQGLAMMREALKSGGRTAVVVFSIPRNNPLLALPGAIFHRLAGGAEPVEDQSAAFRLGRPGALERAFSRACYRDIQIRVVAAPVRPGSVAECVAFIHDVFAGGGEVLRGLTERDRRTFWAELTEAIRALQRDGRCEVPCELVLGVGTN